MPEVLHSLYGRKLGLSAGGRLLLDPAGRGGGAAGILLPNTNAGPSTALTTFTAQRAFDTYTTIPANTLEVGSVIRIRYQGIQTAVNGTDTSQFILNIGSTLAASTLAVTSGTALTTSTAAAGIVNEIFHGEYELQVRTVGSSGTMVGVGIFKKVPNVEATYAAVDDILASTTIDTTIDQIVCVGCVYGASSASNSCRLDFFRVIVH